jgi:uncharacterized YigZ family protein
MYCVESTHRVEEIIKKSRFIGIIAPCRNKKELAAALSGLQADYPTASHIAFAYRIHSPKGIVSRFFDAGEPSGTAGKPIFQHLEGKDLINVLLAVVRYFGGIKLGAGGLTRAYGGTAKKVIDGSSIVPYVEYRNIALQIEYNQLQPLGYQLKQLKGEIVEQSFSDKVKVVVRLPADHAEAVAAQFAGNQSAD